MANANRKRVFGDKVQFKSLSCAPLNELGVVYLFGVLHDTFDFKIESIQAGFPDCIARRSLDCGRSRKTKAWIRHYDAQPCSQRDLRKKHGIQ